MEKVCENVEEKAKKLFLLQPRNPPPQCRQNITYEEQPEQVKAVWRRFANEN